MTINGANFTVTADTLCNDGSVEKYFTGGAPSGWSLGALGAGGGSPLFTPLFEDDFSSGDLSSHNDYLRWGKDGQIPSAGSGASSIVSVTGREGGQVNAVKFTYGTWQELGFCLTESVSQQMTATDSPETDSHYPEVWISYDMLVPANYYHSDSLNGVYNNKGFASIWQGTYSPEVKLQGVTEWWPKPDGTSEISVNIDGHLRNFDSVAAERQSNYYGTTACLAFVPSDLGQWRNFCLHWIAPTSHGASDGIFEFYVDGALAARMTGIDYQKRNPQVSGPIGFNRGYLLGYHNSTYAEETTFYITNFKFGGVAQ